MAIKIRVDAKKMEDLLRNFYLITGIRIVVFDDNFEKNLKKGLIFSEGCNIITFVASDEQAKNNKGLSPNGKATDSDSVSSRFESL